MRNYIHPIGKTDKNWNPPTQSSKITTMIKNTQKQTEQNKENKKRYTEKY